MHAGHGGRNATHTGATHQQGKPQTAYRIWKRKGQTFFRILSGMEAESDAPQLAAPNQVLTGGKQDAEQDSMQRRTREQTPEACERAGDCSPMCCGKQLSPIKYCCTGVFPANRASALTPAVDTSGHADSVVLLVLVISSQGRLGDACEQPATHIIVATTTSQRSLCRAPRYIVAMRGYAWLCVAPLSLPNYTHVVQVATEMCPGIMLTPSPACLPPPHSHQSRLIAGVCSVNEQNYNDRVARKLLLQSGTCQAGVNSCQVGLLAARTVRGDIDQRKVES